MSDYQQIQLRNRFNMTFTNGSSTEIARMDELDDGSLTFAGDMDESAKIFFEQVVKYNSLEIQALEAKIKELEAEREWVSVEDRLPEIEDEYDVYGYRRDWVEHGFCNQRQASKRIPDMYFDGVLFDTDFIVTHWMSLPQSPKGE